ncbi:unnamed protein product [Prorocentrum cordatum]|uniref:Uncharacterized protein n=1 Tax=Prorocentrum cordatum TaxID=2364126 RepID=A0ABN9RI75_9DINO|nr:unnamed protein product [Polarella glacialis]
MVEAAGVFGCWAGRDLSTVAVAFGPQVSHSPDSAAEHGASSRRVDLFPPSSLVAPVPASLLPRSPFQALPRAGFSDPLARALEGGPPLRLKEGGGVEFDFGPVAGGGSAVGSRVKWGVMKESVGEVDQSPEAQRRREALRAAAARDLVNIDEEERERRRTLAVPMAVLSAAFCAFLLLTGAPWTSRVAVLPFFFLTGGLYLSGQEGL